MLEALRLCDVFCWTRHKQPGLGAAASQTCPCPGWGQTRSLNGQQMNTSRSPTDAQLWCRTIINGGSTDPFREKISPA